MPSYGAGPYGAGLYGVGLSGTGTPPWTFVVCDIAGLPIGQPLAKGRRFSPGVSRTETATFQVDIGTRLWSSIAAGDCTLKVYNSAATLVFFGDIVSDELNADGQAKTVSVTAADLSFRLARRFIGKSGAGTAYTATDAGTIIHTELANANSEFPTGISVGNKDTFLARTLTFNWRRFSDVLGDLAAISSSYEWSLRYTDGTPPTVYLDLLATVGGNVSGSVFFEYGTGRSNLQTYRRVRSIEQTATRVYAIGQGSTNSVVAYDTGAELVRRFEDVISASDITDVGLLDSLAAAHVAFRHLPRQTVSVSTYPALTPAYGVAWSKGDTVTLRATVDGVVDTNGTARVWAADIAIDEFGNESPTLTLEPQ